MTLNGVMTVTLRYFTEFGKHAFEHITASIRGGTCASPDEFLVSERELTFTFAICYRPSVCRLSVTFVRHTQAIEIFSNVFTSFGTLAICDVSIKILRRSSQSNPSVSVLNRRGVAKYSDFAPFQSYISETVQDRQ